MTMTIYFWSWIHRIQDLSSAVIGGCTRKAMYKALDVGACMALRRKLVEVAKPNTRHLTSIGFIRITMGCIRCMRSFMRIIMWCIR